jgi:hypothetical protein
MIVSADEHHDSSRGSARPSNAEVFWQGKEADLGDGKIITGSVWPKVSFEHVFPWLLRIM